MEFKFLTKNKDETIALGKKLSTILLKGDIVTLTGDLGAGKTTFVSGVARGLGIYDDIISPTFNILKCYSDGRIPLYHIDAYRLENVNKEIGLEEFIDGDGVSFIEWPKFIKEILYSPHLEIEIRNMGADNRKFIYKPLNKEMLNRIKSIV